MLLSLDDIESKRSRFQIVGMDEVGWGACAGPLVVGAVAFDPDDYPEIPDFIKDSKTLSEKKREKAFDWILAHATCAITAYEWYFDSLTDMGYERRNCYKIACATTSRLKEWDPYFVLDGNQSISGHNTAGCIPKGDLLVKEIAAASIVAKVFRDHIMKGLHEFFPEYNWKKNKGYGTQEHARAIETYGYTKFHRTSYSIVQARAKKKYDDSSRENKAWQSYTEGFGNSQNLQRSVPSIGD
jgi:ribonuclease HII